MRQHYGLILFVLFSIFSLIGCRDKGVVVLDEMDDELKLYDYYIDKNGEEGIVVCLDEDTRAMVMSLDEVERSWGPLGCQVTTNVSKKETSSDRYPFRMLYTMSILGISQFPAQAWCAEKNHGQIYNIASWHLPSFSKWGFGSKEIESINQCILKYGGTPLSIDACYWTCTEDYDECLTTLKDSTFDAVNRAVLSTASGQLVSEKNFWIKNNIYKVRAVKYIYYKYYDSIEDH